jgi:thiol-disulfide isomerase/thioredoxin
MGVMLRRMIRSLRVTGLPLLLICSGAWLAAGRAHAQSVVQIRSFEGGTGWLNSATLDIAQLRGKVVLVDFREYTCLNCLRTLPYLREWYRRYSNHGFVIVGVHTPEFDFSGQRANVAAAAKRLEVTWPIVLDDRFAIWKRYGNNDWPHEYLFDQAGRLVENFIGEGGYPQTEAKIQALLKSADPHVTLPPVMALLPQDSYDKPGAVCYPHTSELLVGRRPIADAANGNPAQDNDYVDDTSSAQDGDVYLQGYWRLSREAAISGESDGYFRLRYHAIQLVAVLKPENGRSVRVDVLQDGHPVARSDAGKDLRYDPQGASYVVVDASRAYDLIMNAQFGQRELRLVPKSDGLGVYDIAFESCEVPGSAK